ncbi:MAG: signal peptidase II [Clostridiales bacterium]|nr:signal peptidase II [Clostridiales bacterium]
MENNETKSASAAIKKFLKIVWEYIKLAKIELIVMIAFFAIDLISKSIVNATIEYRHSVDVIPNFLRFSNVHNYNAVFGSDWMRKAFGDTGSMVLFCILAFVATGAFLFFMVKNRHGSLLFRVSLGMLAAGAMGNCIDRMAFGYVRDFIEIVYFGLTIFGKQSFYVFNIADSALVIGVIMVIVYFIFFYKEKDKKPIPAAAESEGEINGDADLIEKDETTKCAAPAEESEVPVTEETTTEEADELADGGAVQGELEKEDEP